MRKSLSVSVLACCFAACKGGEELPVIEPVTYVHNVVAYDEIGTEIADVFFTYDEKDRLISIERDSNQDDIFDFIRKYSYSGNSHQLVSYTDTKSNGVETKSAVYHYDENSRVEKIVYDSNNDDVDDAQKLYSYIGATGEISEVWDDDDLDGAAESKNIFAYTSGNITSIDLDDDADGIVDVNSTFTYTVDNLLVSATHDAIIEGLYNDATQVADVYGNPLNLVFATGTEEHYVWTYDSDAAEIPSLKFENYKDYSYYHL